MSKRASKQRGIESGSKRGTRWLDAQSTRASGSPWDEMNERRVKPDGRLRQRERFLREESQTLDEWYKNPDSVWSASVSPSAGTWVPTPKREHDRVASQATASPSVASPMLPLESHDETPVSPASGLSRTWSWWFNDSEQPRSRENHRPMFLKFATASCMKQKGRPSVRGSRKQSVSGL